MPQLPTSNLGQISQAKKAPQPTSSVPQSAAPTQPQVQPQMPAPEQQAQEQQQQQTPVFTVSKFLEEDMMALKGINPDGTVQVEDMRTGKLGTFDPKKQVKLDGFDPSQIDIQYNSPEDPMGESIYSNWERIKKSFGDSTSSKSAEAELTKLKSRFSEATYNSKGELVVNDKGLWRPADPNNWSGSDPWTVSEAIGDFADMAKPLTVGIGASLLAGPIGAATGLGVIGANVAGTAIAAGAANNIIGRSLDTYKADPQQALADIGLDMVMTAGGMGIYKYGVKPPAQAIAKAFGNAGKVMAEPTKEMFSKIYGGVLGKNPDALMFAMRHTDDAGESLVLKTSNKFMAKAGGISEDARAMASIEASNALRQTTIAGDAAVTRQWRTATAKTLTAPGTKAYNIAYEPIEQGMKTDWLKQGIGGLNKKGEFIPLDDMVKAQMSKLGISQGPDDVVTRAGMTDLSKALNDFFKNIKIRSEGNSKLLSGRSGLKRSLDLQKDLNESLGQIIRTYKGEKGSEAVVQAALKAKGHVEKQILDAMTKMHPQGGQAAAAWQARNAAYSESVTVLNKLKAAASNPDIRELEGLVQSFSGSNASQAGMKAQMNEFEKILLPSERGLVKEIQTNLFSREFMDYSARTIQGSSVMNIVRGAAVLIPGGARMADKVLEQAIKFVHNMSSTMKAQAIKDPTIFSRPESAIFLNSLYNSTMQGMSSQIKAQEMLKQEAQKATQKGE